MKKNIFVLTLLFWSLCSAELKSDSEILVSQFFTKFNEYLAAEAQGQAEAISLRTENELVKEIVSLNSRGLATQDLQNKVVGSLIFKRLRLNRKDNFHFLKALPPDFLDYEKLSRQQFYLLNEIVAMGNDSKVAQNNVSKNIDLQKTQFIKYLIQLGHDPRATDLENLTSLDVSLQVGCWGCSQRLYSAGALFTIDSIGALFNTYTVESIKSSELAFRNEALSWSDLSQVKSEKLFRVLASNDYSFSTKLIVMGLLNYIKNQQPVFIFLQDYLDNSLETELPVLNLLKRLSSWSEFSPLSKIHAFKIPQSTISELEERVLSQRRSVFQKLLDHYLLVVLQGEDYLDRHFDAIREILTELLSQAISDNSKKLTLNLIIEVWSPLLVESARSVKSEEIKKNVKAVLTMLKFINPEAHAFVISPPAENPNSSWTIRFCKPLFGLGL